VKISDALSSVRRLYLDTAPVIFYVEENPTYIAKMDAIIKIVENSTIETVSSAILLTEVLTHPMKTGATKIEQEYRDILVNSGDYRLLPVTLQIAESAADFRARYNLRTPDALHIATAVAARCDKFLTNDNGIKRVTEITVLVLDDLTIT
jgi:predicted nucleic acid-binding protein